MQDLEREKQQRFLMTKNMYYEHTVQPPQARDLDLSSKFKRLRKEVQKDAKDLEFERRAMFEKRQNEMLRQREQELEIQKEILESEIKRNMTSPSLIPSSSQQTAEFQRMSQP